MPKGIPNKQYTPAFKKLVIETMQKEKLSYSETARRFEVNSHHRIQDWERIYLSARVQIYGTLQGGTAGLPGLLQQPSHQGKAEGLAACNSQTASPFGCLNNFYFQILSNFLGALHIPTRLFKQAVSLSKQARAIEAALDGINPLNAGKKKEEALSMLKKWFPQMENFSEQLKKYKVTIKDLLEENQKLEARAKASESGKMKDRMERAKLESELENMQRLVDRIPPEVLAELKRQQRTRGR